MPIDYAKDNKIGLEKDVAIEINKRLDKKIMEINNTNLPSKTIKNSYTLSSKLGFILGNIMPAMKPDIKLNSEIVYERMLHYHNATLDDDKNYDFMTFDSNFGVAPAEIIQNDIAKHPETIGAKLIKKTSIVVSKKNGVPMIDDKPIKGFDPTKHKPLLTKNEIKDNNKTQKPADNIASSIKDNSSTHLPSKIKNINYNMYQTQKQDDDEFGI